ncbi:hypothetical protein Q3G72_031132 [Acer saccharum]|nr:hypothetical protein Q3G72_031132 [Acer saccharum]
MDEVVDVGLLSTFQALHAQLHLKKRFMANRERCVNLQKTNESLRKDRGRLDKANIEIKEKASTLEKRLKQLKEIFFERDRQC